MPVLIKEVETWCSVSVLVGNYEEEQKIVILNSSRYHALIVIFCIESNSVVTP